MTKMKKRQQETQCHDSLKKNSEISNLTSVCYHRNITVLKTEYCVYLFQ